MPILSLYDEQAKDWKEIPTLRGNPSTIEIGQVSTLPENSFAYVSNSGNTHDAILNFGLPRGASGITPVRGVDYWTAEDQQKIINDVTEKLDFQFQKLMNAILNQPVTYVLKNKSTLDSLLDLSNNTINYNGEVKNLNPGDIFLLTDQDEPDYWFGEDSNGEKLHELETRKIDLSDYIQKDNMVLITYSEYDDLISQGKIDNDTYYFIYEE